MSMRLHVLAVAAVFLLTFHLDAYQKHDAMRPSPPGKLVSVGPHRLHIHCIGKGAPTVVMEAGAGDFSIDWALVQPSIAKFTRVCTYDRAGYAWSDAGPMPRTMRQITTELHLLLRKTKEKAPYVLVGQSLGGLIVRVFAEQYPQDVAGIVLIDSSHEDNQIMLNDRLVLLRKLSRGRAIPPVELRKVDPVKPESRQETTQPSSLSAPYNKLPAELQRIRLWAMGQPAYAAARSSEFDYLAEELTLMHNERSKREYPLADKPLIVLTRGKDSSAAHQKLQTDLARLSRNSKQITVETSGHHIQLDAPDAVVTAVNEVIKAVRGPSGTLPK